MDYKARYLSTFVSEDLAEKMVFIGGPRQVGKTTFAKHIQPLGNVAYYNWDNQSDRKGMLSSEWPRDKSLIILDEIHKYNKWKTWIKGEYDVLAGTHQFLITGSARLDLYRKGGDSLQGRYHYYRLHPFTLAELIGPIASSAVGKELVFQSTSESISGLDHFGGFPEPFLKQSERTLRRWHKERVDRLLRDDIRDTEIIHDMSKMNLLSQILPSKVGSLLSLNSIREDLEVSHRTISHWVDILETFYYVYRIYPYSPKGLIRSLKKEPKLYMWDWSELDDEGARFENMIGSHLLKYVHFLQDSEGFNVDLNFLRDAQKREVDFLVTLDGKPWFAVEAKLADSHLSLPLLYFNERISIPYSYQVLKKDGVDFYKEGIRVISANKFLSGLV